MVVIVFVFRFVVGFRILSVIKEIVFRYGRNGVIIGILLGFFMIYVKVISGEGINDDGMFDRVYRLRYEMM